MNQKFSSITIIDPVGIKAGLDQYDEYLAKGFQANGVQVKIFSNYDSRFSSSVFPSDFGSSLFFLPKIYSAYLKALKLIKTEYVILHLFKATVLDVWLAKKLTKLNIRIIYILHDAESLLNKSEKNSKLNKCLELAEKIFVHNQFTADFVISLMPSIFSKVSIVPHVDYDGLPSEFSKSEARRKLGLPENKKLVLFFGMIKPSKGLDLLIRAMKFIDAELIIAGRMRMHSFDVYDELIDECVLRGHVHLDVGYVSSFRRDLYFKAADVIVLPYRKIFQSGVLLMALRYQLPVIMSDLPPNAEFVKDYLCADLFKSNDEKDLHQKINTLLNDQELQNQLIAAGLQKLEKEHASGKVAATIIHSISK